MDNFKTISRLLTAAFLLFAGSLFTSIGIQYILRQEKPKAFPSYRKSKLCIIHTWFVIALLIAGFVLLNIVLMNVGQRALGIVGITLLGVIPVWYYCITLMENAGHLEDSPTAEEGNGNITGETVDDETKLS